jgi:deazaflavin-dependent oxidoreductase (nitroreductase family)
MNDRLLQAPVVVPCPPHQPTHHHLGSPIRSGRQRRGSPAHPAGAGRKSGRLYEIPVRVAILDDHRWLMSMLGEAQWVRNLRTAGTAELVVGGTVEPVRARAIHGEQKGAFLRQYFQQSELRARYASR